MPIVDQENGLFLWSDENGSEVTWRVVGKHKEGLVWYATGKVKPGPVTPGGAGKGRCGADSPPEGRERRRRVIQHERSSLYSQR